MLGTRRGTRCRLTPFRLPILVAGLLPVLLVGGPPPAAAAPAETTEAAGAVPPPAAVAALAARAAELGSVWPGYDPATTPLAVFDGESTWLFHHPSPPAEFVEREGGYVFPGRHAVVDANTSVELGGVLTAAVLATHPLALNAEVGLFAHEAFHVYQRLHHPGWQSNEAVLFTYPFADETVMASRLAEEAALRGALASTDPVRSRCLAARALAARAARYAVLAPEHVAYERHGELNEGTARYVQARYGGESPGVLLPADGFAADGIRWRVYDTGAAMAFLLDRFAPGWKTHLELGAADPMDDMLAAAVTTAAAQLAGCNPAPVLDAQIRQSARRRVAAYRDDLAAKERAYLDAPGLRVRIVAGKEPLWPQRFDPLNVSVLGPGRVLHSRFVRLGNGSGTIEALGRVVLTVGHGEHPIFSGVSEVLITGLAAAPVAGEDGTVTLKTPELTLALKAASVERDGDEVVIRLP